MKLSGISFSIDKRFYKFLLISLTLIFLINPSFGQKKDYLKEIQERYRNRVLKFEENGKVGLKKGNEILIPAIYEEFGWLNNQWSYLPAKLNGKWGLINNLHEVIIPFGYKKIGKNASIWQANPKTN